MDLQIVNLDIERSSYEIYNFFGKKIMSGLLTSDDQVINISGNKKGVYILKLVLGSQLFYEKIILK